MRKSIVVQKDYGVSILNKILRRLKKMTSKEYTRLERDTKKKFSRIIKSRREGR